MGKNIVLEEAKRLYALGFAIIWLHPKSKRPIETKWTTGPKKEWSELEKTYREGFNLGVRLGAPSKIKDGFLGVIDVDIKSKEKRHLDEAREAVKSLIIGTDCAVVRSGRGNGSRHYYFVTRKPASTHDLHWSEEVVKVFMPSAKKPSKRDIESLSEKEIADGFRIRRAWEVSVLGTGAQVVLPPSIHPDSGEEYRWSRPIKKLPFLAVRTALPDAPNEKEATTIEDFEVSPVELAWLPISKEVREGIVSGKGVTDRSGFLLRASSALYSAGLTDNEVLTVLTDRDTFLGEVGYDHAQTNSRKVAASWIRKYTFEKVKREKELPTKSFESAPVPAKKLTKAEEAKQTEELEAERDWTQDIVRTQQGLPMKSVQNVVHIIANAVSKSVVRRDEFAFRDTYSHDTEWGGKKGDVVSDDDVATIKYWLGTQYQFEPNNNTISDGLIVLARRNSFDPVREMLDGLPAWDGKIRLDSFLKENFGAKGATKLGGQEYLAQVFRKWMVAMVLRVYEPGAKFDWMPVFEGQQEAGKSTFGKILVGDKYFLDWLPNLNDKDSALALQGIWGVEMAELSQFKRNEIESIKAFITRTTDKFRPPFGRRLIESPRRCVFFGTTNKKKYLVDETGNRRFKPVEVGNLNFKVLERDRLQLFAEAKQLYMTGAENERTLDLTGVAKLYERKIHQEKMIEDDSNSMEESMRNFLEKVAKKDIDFDLEKFQMLDLFEGVGPLGSWRKENKNLQFAAKMLRRMGAERRTIKGSHYWKMGKK